MNTDFVIITDYDLEEPLTPEMVAETTGARISLILRLVDAGILETINETNKRTISDEAILLPRRAVLRLRQMQRLRRDLGVNFAGASVILDLAERMDKMKREIEQMRMLTDRR
ncbi:MAG TPA: chaperone modulator CbpM [Pyrinomonadaceae bacterium]|nr:chaperone modulator CbpM [Pyrinomonadaceae bacterium]